MDRSRTGPGLALGAAVLFGLSAPAAKLLAGTVDPWLLAGLLYLGSGVGEGLSTALLAWSFFRESFDARIAVGMAAIAAGAAVLSWRPSEAFTLDVSALLVMAACLAWAIDNNLTRKVSGGDPLLIAALKGGVAGGINFVLALVRQAPWPTPAVILGAGVVGFLGYDTSLVLFVLALRLLGTARTGAYFSTAPFVGAMAGAVALREPLTWQTLFAAGLMGAGVWLHLTERHEHEHQHEALEHTHAHVHDEHHQHPHAPGIPLGEPHRHLHVHAPLRHRHPHFPDLHHRHHH